MIPYKYTVFRPQGKNVPPKPLWECLLGFAPYGKDHVNRTLLIREDSIKSNGETILNINKNFVVPLFPSSTNFIINSFVYLFICAL